jgi:hypothetical protein
MAFEAANYEAEDVFMEADHVDLFPLELRRASGLRKNASVSFCGRT